MGKTRAEIQKAYRERKKSKDPEGYLKSERDRQKKYYVPAANLSDKRRKERNFQNKLRNQKSQAKKADLLRRLRVREQSDEEPSSESGYASLPGSSTESRPRLVVQLPALQVPARGNGAKKTRARALAKAHKSIKKLQDQKKCLERKLKTKNKQLERMQKRVHRVHHSESRGTLTQMLTPRRKTELEIKSLGLNPKSARGVRRKLMLTNVLLSEIKETSKQSKRKQRAILHRMVAGKIAHKYKCLKGISQVTGLSRRSLGQCNSKTLSAVSETRKCISRLLASKVENFLCREDNCRAQPGKADVKKGKQTKVLTDYMKNLHEKFTAENPELSISLAAFCRLRPHHVLLARFIARNACQCLRHQNMALKVQTMRKLGLKISDNPENLCVHKDNLKTMLEETFSDVNVVKYRTWKRVELENKTKKTMVVEEELTKEIFTANVIQEIEEFSNHVSRLRAQYSQLKANKEKLKEHEMIVQMDFAENYTCRSLDEVQTAYWSLTSVTIHPVVAYMRHETELKHQSFVIISDTMAHSSSTVCTFMDAIIPELKKIDPELKKLHYWTDSPSSQYRNRFIFHTIANHRKLYNCDAQWNYFEAGHGKSACDGLGGTVKRMADEATRQGNALIQNPRDFYNWAINSSMKEVIFVFVDKQLCQNKQAALLQRKISSLKNTMKLHAVAMDKLNNKVMKTKITSCYCDNCASGNFCELWTSHNVDYATTELSSDIVQPEEIPEQVITTGMSTDETTSNDGLREKETSREKDSFREEKKTRGGEQVGEMHEAEETSTNEDSNPQRGTEDEQSRMTKEDGRMSNQGDNINVLTFVTEGNYVIAKYDGNPYVGLVKAVDIDEDDCKISFMEKAKCCYRWPKPADILWVNGKDVICTIAAPRETGKSKRAFKLADEDQKIFDNI